MLRIFAAPHLYVRQLQSLIVWEIEMIKSSFLASIIEKQNRISTLQVAFIDVEKYSKRRTANQILVVRK